MNAWTIYWILQLDSIGRGLTGLYVAAGLVTAITVMFGAFAMIDGEEDLKKRCDLLAKRLGAACVALFVVSIFVPSTRTVAAMVIVPAIANNETIRKESGELYDLAKQALRDAVTDKAKDAAKESAK